MTGSIRSRSSSDASLRTAQSDNGTEGDGSPAATAPSTLAVAAAAVEAREIAQSIPPPRVGAEQTPAASAKAVPAQAAHAVPVSVTSTSSLSALGPISGAAASAGRLFTPTGTTSIFKQQLMRAGGKNAASGLAGRVATAVSSSAGGTADPQPNISGSSSLARRNTTGSAPSKEKQREASRLGKLTDPAGGGPGALAGAPAAARGSQQTLVDPEAEYKRLRKEAKRRAQEERNAEKVVLGTRIGEDHVNYALMYDMLTGIRVAVSRCVSKPPRGLTQADFTGAHKLAFDITGNELTPSSKYDFKFKDYAPWVFRHLREFFKIEPADYLVSLTGKYVLSELGSPGKSGSFFYYSQDYRFIIKTIHSAEHKFLRKILVPYYEHVKQNPNTLIARFYGLHRVKLPRGRKIHFVVMGNVFPPNKDMHETFDLKGSSVGRSTAEAAIRQNPHIVMKDLNWAKFGRTIILGPEKRALFVEQLERDVRMLTANGIMDYSLLLGVHYLARGNSENLRDKNLSMFEPTAGNQRAQSPTEEASRANAGANAGAGAGEASEERPRSSASPRGPQAQVSAPVLLHAASPHSVEAPATTAAPSAQQQQHLLEQQSAIPPHQQQPTLPPILGAITNKVSALRKAVNQSDPIPLGSMPPGSGRLPEETPEERRHCIFYADDGGFRATDARNAALDEVYFLGVIDILTPYNYVKKFEHAWKGIGNDINGISAVPPRKYGTRFLDFMKRAISTDPEGGGQRPTRNVPISECLENATAIPPVAQEGSQQGSVSHSPQIATSGMALSASAPPTPHGVSGTSSYMSGSSPFTK